MQSEFISYECMRQIKGAIQDWQVQLNKTKNDWDVLLDREYAPRMAFQGMSRYNRNFYMRTQTVPNSVQPSVIVYMAIAESGADQALITQMQAVLVRDWALKFHGQGAQYDANATIRTWANMSPIEQVEFYSFGS